MTYGLFENNKILKVDLFEYEENKDYVISSEIEEIYFTSNKKECKNSIFLLDRKKDITIYIQDLNIVTERKIAIDLRGGFINRCKINILFSGENRIGSKENIGICISNNKEVEIKGEEKSELLVEGGSGVPAIGSNYYTEGVGNITFSGRGKVIALVGKYREKDTVAWQGENGSYAIGFYSSEKKTQVSIKIYDEINLKVIGEDGQCISSIKEKNCAGRGGSAIEFNNKMFLKKEGNGLLELIAGRGGNCKGEYTTGGCGKGGAVIRLGSGEIKIESKAILTAGAGGCAKEKLILAKGGEGGDIVETITSEEEEDKKILLKIGKDIILKTGDGGISGQKIYREKIINRDNPKYGIVVNAMNKEVIIEGDKEKYLQNKNLIIGSSKKNSNIEEIFIGNIEFKEKIENEVEKNINLDKKEEKSESGTLGERETLDKQENLKNIGNLDLKEKQENIKKIFRNIIDIIKKN
ncbi:MAG: hypothetical protein ACRDAU_09630 [Clostridium sp.]